MFGETSTPFDNTDLAKFFAVPAGGFTAKHWAAAVRIAEGYVLTYFAKIIDPQAFVFWDGAAQAIIIVQDKGLSHLLMPQKFKREWAETLADGKINTVKQSWDPLGWFRHGYLELCKIDSNPMQPRTYTPEDGQRRINIARLFMHAGAQGPITKAGVAGLKVVLDHLKEVWANGKDDVYEYLLNWFARVAQCQMAGSLLFAYSEAQGTGKSSIPKFFHRYVFGQDTCLFVFDPQHVLGEFTGQLEGKSLVTFEEMPEATTNSWRRDSNRIKSLATEDRATIRKMRSDPIEVDNRTSLIVLSNNRGAIYIAPKDRRAMALDISDKYAGTGDEAVKHFNELYAAFNDEVGLAMFRMLQARDISGFVPGKFPDTNLRREMKVETIHPVYAYVKHRMGCIDAQDAGLDESAKDLYQRYAENQKESAVTAVKFGRMVGKDGLGFSSFTKDSKGTKARWYKVSYRQLHGALDKLDLIHEIDELPTPDDAEAAAKRRKAALDENAQ